MAVMQPPQGWYPDPADASHLRWWAGDSWTQSTVPNPAAPGFVVSRRRVWPWVVVGIAGFLALVGITAAIYVPRIVNTFKAPIDAANVYLRDWRDGNRAAAYPLLCIRRFGAVSYDQYLREVQAQDAQTGRLLRFNAHQTHNGFSSVAVVDVDITTTRGRGAIAVSMVKEHGHWHWCGWAPSTGPNGFSTDGT
jgi:Protein of unknown function (DUF2510)